jgi:hypothetical protein
MLRCSSTLFTPNTPVMHRSLVACRPIDPDTMQITPSDGEVWLHDVERDEQGNRYEANR